MAPANRKAKSSKKATGAKAAKQAKHKLKLKVIRKVAKPKAVVKPAVKAVVKPKAPVKAAVAPVKAVATKQFKKQVKQELPPGRYIIADPCYVFSRDFYDDVWGDALGYDTGCFVGPSGVGFMIHGTGGDGMMPGSDGRTYGVDSGTIGVISAELAERGCGERILTFTAPVCFSETPRGFHVFSSVCAGKPFRLLIDTR